MPQCNITSCQALFNCLNGAVQGDSGSQTLELSAELFPVAGELVQYLGATSLLIKQLDAKTPIVSNDKQPPCATITGTAILFENSPDKFNYNVTIDANYETTTGKVLLLLKATPLDTTSWTFGGNFEELPEYVAVVDIVLKQKPSFYDTMAVSNPVFTVATPYVPSTTVGLSFTGTVDMTQGDLAPAGKYLPDPKNIALSGSIAIRKATFPEIVLTGSLPGYSIPDIGSATLAFGTKDAGADPEKNPAESTLLITGTSQIGSFPAFTLSAPILQGESIWALTGALVNPEQYPLPKILSSLVTYVGGSNLPLPEGMEATGFFLESVTVAIKPTKSPSLDSVQMIGFRVSSTKGKSWTAPIFGLTVSDLTTSWEVLAPLTKTPQMTGAIGGILQMGTGDATTRLLIEIGLDGIETPSALDVTISAALDEAYPVNINTVFKQLTGLDLGLNLNITELLFKAQTGPRLLQFTTVLDGTWPFPVPLIVFGKTNFTFQYSPNSVSGSVSVEVTLVSFKFLVSAAYAGSGQGWEFRGLLAPDSQNNSLQDFVDAITEKRYPSLPANLGKINLQKLDISFNTGSGAFAFDGILQWPFEFDNFFNLTIEAELSLKSPGPAKGQVRKYSGFARGSLSINDFNFSVIYSFDIANNTNISFVFEFKGATLTCAYSNNGKTKLLTANLGGVTFGGIVDYLVNLVDPSLNFSLPAPWNVLYDLSFDNLTLTANLTKNTVGVAYEINTNLGIIDLKSIGLTYVSKAGRSTVMIAMTGRFFDQTYEKDNPLGWDMLNEQPPTAPGKGEQLLDLRYVGIGQNVGFRSAQSFTNVQSVLKAMTSDFAAVDNDDENPLNSALLSNLQFAGDGRWLIGADFTLMEAVSLSVVFNDPTLYGLRIALAGEKVKSFSGLDFQILYKKVTDTIGVYHIELTLPEAFRQLNFGALAITIPIVIVDVYTNGNFRIDFGFPVGIDFSKSFCLQAGPFIGYGGFYFALLDGSTSERVPRITNGTFSPVIEAGLALSVGLGRTIDKGIFKAGATITVQGILQGVFGWYNPNDRSAASAQYYWIQGTVAIAGKLNGSVDFVVISAEVSLSLSASITMTFEAYKAALVKCIFEVTASASVKILFIRVSFSFSMQLEISFTIGSSSTAPWILDSKQPLPQLLRQQASWQQRRLTATNLQRTLVAMLGEDSGTFDWTPRSVFPSVKPIALSLIPALTVGLPELTFSTARLAAGNQKPQVQTVFALFVPSTVPPAARGSKQILSVSDPNADLNPFNLLCAGMLRWALSSYTRNEMLSAAAAEQEALSTDLEAISLYLGDAEKWQEAFNYPALAQMMLLNYQLHISSPVGPQGIVHPKLGLLSSAATAAESSYTVFPMVPELNVTYGSDAPVDYGSYNQISSLWEEALGTYNSQLKSQPGATQMPSLSSEERSSIADGPSGLAEPTESLSKFLFRDYFAMVTRGVVQSASDLMRSYPYEAKGASGPIQETLASIAAKFNGPPIQYRSRQGDTIARVAARFGLHPDEVHQANPMLKALAVSEPLAADTALVILASVTPESIAVANSSYPLNSYYWKPVTMSVDGVKHQVRAAKSTKSESLSAIAYSYGIKGPASIFTDGGQYNENAINTALLQPGAPLVIPAQSVTMFDPATDNSRLVAAFFFVRNLGPAKLDAAPWYADVNWYQQWILEKNQPLTSPWTVPVVKLVDDSLVEDGTQKYVTQGNGSTLSADTPALVAGYFAMTQLAPAPYTDAFNNFKVTGKGGAYSVPALTHIVQPGDTFWNIAQTFGISVTTLVNANAGTEGLLQLLAVLSLPPITYTIATGDTFASVANNLDLTVEELARSVQKDPGILAPYISTQTQLIIPDVPARNVDLLVADLIQYGSFNNVSGMVANFLMHGIRVPEPDATIVDKTFPPSTPIWSLYEMAGQQFPAPQSPSGPTGVNVVFRQTSPTGWIRFDAAGPSGSTGLPELPLGLTASYFYNAPGLTLHPEILAGPASLPLYRETPPQHSFSQSISWQSPSVLTFPGPTGSPGASGSVQPQAGQPSLWIFPSSLQQVGETTVPGPTAATPPYELVLQSTDSSTATAETPVPHYAWSMAVDITVQQAPSSTSSVTMPNTYIVLGADQDGRDDLLKAWTYLQNTTSGGQLYLLYSPGSSTNNSKGLSSAIADSTRTFLLKSNLTTVTRSNQPRATLAASLPEMEYSATLGNVESFLKLLWEASITGSGGFYLNYQDNNGSGLPASLFSDSDTTTLTLLFVEQTQNRQRFTQRGLFPFNNCVIVGDNIDAASSSLFAQLADPTQSDLQRITTAPAGNVGFYMARRDPEAWNTTGILTPAEQTRSLYNLSSFQLSETSGFNESNHGLPIGSSEAKVAGVSGPTGPGVWWYQQLVPIAQFGKQNQTPLSIALPDAADNPYAGIAGPTGLTGPASLNNVAINLSFNDIYGNHTALGATVDPIVIPVGYIDELIGMSLWPGIGMDYVFLPGTQKQVLLETQISLQTSRYLPSGTYTYTQAHEAAVADAQRYSQIFYQVQQHDLNFFLATNLGKVQIGPESLKAPISAFVSKANVFIDTVSALEQHVYTTAAKDTLDGISKTFGITSTMLVEANGDSQVQKLFAGQIIQPTIVAAPPMNSLNALVQGQSSTTYPPTCGGTSLKQRTGEGWVGGLRLARPEMLVATLPAASIDDGTPLTPSELATHNSTAPLTPGSLLVMSTNTGSPKAADDTMLTIADTLNCAVYAEFPDATEQRDVEVGLYISNFKTMGIVTPNKPITIGGVTANTGIAPTLEAVQASFKSLNWSTGDFVAQLQTVPGLFKLEAKLEYATYFVPQPATTTTTTAPPTFSLADMPASAGTIATLATANAAVTNFYYAGTPVYLSYNCYAPQQFDTFNSLATQFGITPAQLAVFNQTVVCKEKSDLFIPSLVSLPAGSEHFASLTPLATDSLLTLADIIVPNDADGGAKLLADINRYLPGIFAENASITLTVKGIAKTIIPPPMASLNDTAVAFDLEFNAFITAISAMTALYRTNGAVLTPVPSMPSTALQAQPIETGSPSWNEVATRFNLQSSEGQPAAVGLLNANRCLESFLLQGATIAGPEGSKPLAVGPYDTVDTLIRRFDLEQQLTVTTADLVKYNGNTPKLSTTGRVFLLPPNSTSVATDVAPHIPPSASTCESQIVFPVSVSIFMARNKALVAPDFVATPAVYKSTSTFSPRGWGQSTTSLDLTNFAVQFELAFATYQLKAAISEESSGTGAETKALWAVNFGSNGVSQFAIQSAKPTFYALAPLSTHLMSGNFPVSTYKSGCGLCGSSTKKFDSVDLDAWMQQFLSTVDLFLTTSYAVPAFEQVGASGHMTAPATVGPVSFADFIHLDGPRSSSSLALLGATGITGCSGCTGGTGNGPSHYESIVSSKLTIAQQLRNDVLPILNGVGATGTYYSGVAQETIYQQMLVQLSNAYNVNAIVQYPVSVTSPCVLPLDPSGASAQIPPRFSGNITPALEIVPPGPVAPSGPTDATSITAAAQNSHISTPYFSQVLGSVQGILKEGATAIYKQKTIVISFNETFESLALRFSEEAKEPITPAHWALWTEFIEEIANDKILLSGATLPMVRIARQVDSSATLEAITSFFGVDAGSVGQANQSLPGILRVSSVLRITGHEPYTVTANETLLDISRKIVPPMEVEALSNAIANTLNLLTPGESLYFAQSLPDVTFSTTKVSLGRVGSQTGTEPALSFLFSIKHPRQYKNVFLNLKYVINEAEYGIQTVSGTGGYQESSWLTFILPFGSGLGSDFGVDTRMPQVQIPIPLRSYPTPPTLLAQSGLPSEFDVPPTTPDQAVAQGKQWDYRFDFSGLNAAQDTDHVEVTFNASSTTPAPKSFTDTARTGRIFFALAQFMDAYPALIADLAILPTLQPGQYDQTAAVAVSVLDILVNGVAHAMLPTFSAAVATSWPDLRYQYRLQTQSANQQLRDLQLTQELGPSGSVNPLWPEIFIQSITGPTSGVGPDTGFQELKFIGATGWVANYQYPDGFSIDQQITQRFRFSGRNVIQNQNAWGGAYLTRNDDLIASGPVGWNSGGVTGPISPIQTNKAFLYETPLVRFIDPMTPLLIDGTAINVAGLTGNAGSSRPLAVQIENMLNAVLEWAASSPVQATSYLSILCSYGYPVAGAGTPEEIVATIPVRLVPTQLLQGSQKTAFAVALSDSILQWLAGTTPRSSGVLIFDLNTFTVPLGASGPTSGLKPILEFENLRIPIVAISDV